MITIDEAGVLLVDVLAALERLEDADLSDKRDGAPLPRGVLTCGQACRFVPALLLMILERYPDLKDDGVLDNCLRNAMAASASGVLQ